MTADALDSLREVVPPAQLKLVADALLDILRRDRGQVVIETRQYRVHSIAITRNILVSKEVAGEGDG